jgi:PAS domain S-box-containing protein
VSPPISLSRRVFLRAFAILILLPFVRNSHARPPSSTESTGQNLDKRVLVLYSDNARSSFGKAQETVFRQTLGDLKEPIEIFIENLDNNRIGEISYDKLVTDFYRNKYRDVNFDVVIAIKPVALGFLINHRGDVFGNPAIVFCDVGGHEKVLENIRPGITGAIVDYDIRPSLELIQRLQPDTQRVTVIFGAAPIEAGWLELARRNVATSSTTLPTDYWVGLTIPETRARLARLPPHSAVLYFSEYRDREGRYFTPTDYLTQVAPGSEVPIYSMSYTYLGTGSVGGRVVDPITDAKIAADFAVRILKGEAPETLKPIIESPTLVFDARALRRFGISPSRLPAGSMVLFREPSIWSRYRRQIVTALAFVILETLLVLFLLLETRARKRAEESLIRGQALQGAISGLSTRLVASPPERIDSEIESGLRKILETEGADRICWYVKSEGAASLVREYSATAPGISQSPAVINPEQIPRTAERLLRGEVVILRSPDELPADAERDRKFFQGLPTKSLLLIPSNGHTSEKGILGIAFASFEKGARDQSIGQFEVLANLLATSEQRKKAHAARLESERRFHSLFRESPVGIALEDLDRQILFVNPALCNVLGYSEEELIGMTCLQISNLEDNENDWAHFQQLKTGLLENYQVDKRYIRKDGTQIWGRLRVSLLNDRASSSPTVVAMVEDISEAKESEERSRRTEVSLRNLAGRLMQAQEEERHRISRDLHDDIGQRLTLFLLELAELRDMLAKAGQNSQSVAVSELHRMGNDLATDIQNLSHGLHSSKLQVLGLPFALRSLGETISSHQNVHVSVHIENVPENLPPELALCIFRVAQEALNNVVKHSGARDAFVELTGTNDTIILKVRDLGIGFDLSAASPGIGFSSMRERLRFFGGEFEVDSIPGNGTEIVAKLKLENAKTHHASAG